MSTEKVEPVVDYQLQNTELMARVLELEQRAIEAGRSKEAAEVEAENRANEFQGVRSFSLFDEYLN